MGSILLQLDDVMSMTDLSNFIVFSLFDFLSLIFSYLIFNKLKLLELHSFFVQILKFFSELHILCRTAR